ncbi:hypothetical protein [Aquibium oceanicum]|uniref:hypothetical protein n=1 Tax=Aquibium oceanicum TaxID=1670800 RepID=UPI000B1AA7F4|nr:hypothetical protein [Aquibium oceanicum]
MLSKTFLGQEEPNFARRCLGALGSAFVHPSRRCGQVANLDQLDNILRRDIGLPPRGLPIRQARYHW